MKTTEEILVEIQRRIDRERGAIAIYGEHSASGSLAALNLATLKALREWIKGPKDGPSQDAAQDHHH